jgi:hypothetical protein
MPKRRQMAEQVNEKAMWIIVRATGKGKPLNAMMYLFSRISVALRQIHTKMYLQR